MPVTTEELIEFNAFAAKHIADESAESLEDVFQAWRESREHTEELEGIRQGIAQANAGLGKPLEEFMDDCCRRNDISIDR